MEIRMSTKERKLLFRTICALVAIFALVGIQNVDRIFDTFPAGFVFDAILGGVLLSILVISVLGLIKSKLKKLKEKGALTFIVGGLSLGIIFGAICFAFKLTPMPEEFRFILPFFITLFLGIVGGILAEMNS